MTQQPNTRLLQLEPLESRQMLSTVNVFAQGDTGTETMNLYINDELVETWNVDQTLRAFEFETSEDVSADQVRVEFPNDAVAPKIRFDRNLRVDKIEIDEIVYEAESASVFVQQDGASSGFLQTEMLNRNGFFEFESSRDTRIEVRARKLETGSDAGLLPPATSYAANLNLLIGGQQVTNFTVGNQDFFTYEYYVERPVSPDQVRIQFTNDVYLPDRFDLNAQIDYLAINGNVFETEDPLVYSSGTWKPEDGIQEGFRESEILHTNGFFQYSELRASEITIRAKSAGQLSGAPEFAQFQVLVDLGGAKPTTIRVGTFSTTDQYQDFVVDLSGNFELNQVRIAFVNDYYETLATGEVIDLNLQVDFVEFAGTIYQTEAPNVTSSGTFVPGVGVELGNWESETLHTNGSFKFQG